MITQNMKKITVREAIEAIRKNGLPKTTGTFYRRKESTGSDFLNPANIISACAIGQGALNLGVGAADLDSALAKITNEGNVNLCSRIVDLNDFTETSIPAIAEIVEKEFTNYLDEYLVLRNMPE